jgi:glycosyltransferase involved in cell wall biosynthesis
MRVCQVLASWEKGGLEKHVIELSNTLSLRHEVHVIVHPALTDQFHESVVVHPLDFSRSRWSLSLLLGLALTIRRIRPDIVHVQANKAASLVSVIKRFLGACKVVGTIHNQKKSSSMFSRLDHVIGVSPGVARQVSGVPVTAVYNGIIPPAQAAPNRARLAQEFGFDVARPVLISVGRLVAAKGFDILVEAAVRSRSQVLIVGDGALVEELQARISSTGAEVVLTGYRSDAQALMAAADGYILSSRREGFAYVVVEALLAELPMIATRIPMIEGVLPDSLLVDVEDIDALANQMAVRTADLAGWRLEMAPTFAFAKVNLTLAGMVENTEQVYRQVLSD